MRSPEYREEKKKEIMKKCYECYCDNGLRDTGIKELGKYCGMTSANLYAYFDNVDDLIVQSTEYCMSKVEDEFMALAPENPQDILRFINEIPHWTAKNHGKNIGLCIRFTPTRNTSNTAKGFSRAQASVIQNMRGGFHPSLAYPAIFFRVLFLHLSVRRFTMHCLKMSII